MLNADDNKHASQVLQIERDYRVIKSDTSSKGEKKKTKGSRFKCLWVQKAVSATIAFTKEGLVLGEIRHN